MKLLSIVLVLGSLLTGTASFAESSSTCKKTKPGTLTRQQGVYVKGQSIRHPGAPAISQSGAGVGV